MPEATVPSPDLQRLARRSHDGSVLRMEAVTLLGVLVPVAAVVAAGGSIVCGGWLVRRLRLPTDLPPTVGFEPDPVTPCPADGPSAAEAPARGARTAERFRLLALARTTHECGQTLAGAADAPHLPEDNAAVIRAAAAEVAAAMARIEPFIVPLRRGDGDSAAAAAVIEPESARALAAKQRAQVAWDAIPDPAMRRRWWLAGALLVTLVLCILVLIQNHRADLLP